jgi:glycosyltransferase involved in cell wall biosynthesis
MRILVVSPIASHPQNQGNSGRIHTLGRCLQALGHLVHFLYYPMEGLTAEQRRDMAQCWDAFHTISCELRTQPPSPGATHDLDDWYDPRLGRCARELHARWRFDAVLVNYVWMSGVLDALPDDLVKIVDTHDVFGDRHKTFIDVGLKPEWFYTTPTQERLGLSRADIVIAIQDREAEHFRALLGSSPTRVTTVGHGVPARFLHRRESAGPLAVGYLGSGNPFNTASIRRFVADLHSAPDLVPHFRFVLAGTICSRFPVAPAPFESLGTVDELRDFYAGVDLVLNPMVGGTGLKIKTLEALSFGLPVLGSDDAWVGIATPDDTWPGEPAPAPLDALRRIAGERALIDRLRERCRAVYLNYLQHQLRAIAGLFPSPAPLEVTNPSSRLPTPVSAMTP